MADAILSRDDGTSVTIPLFESGGNFAVARDVGKPTAMENELGREDMFVRDDLSAGDAFTLAGRLEGASAYSDAKTLAEDLIKPRLPEGGPAQTLDLSALPGRGSYSVVPASDTACTLTYIPGQTQLVEVQLTLNVVDSVGAGGSQQTQSYSTPDSGDGIKLDRSGTSVTLAVDQEVKRKVGRPGTKLQPQPGDLPIAYDEDRPANDEFEISAELTGSNSESDAETLEETIVRPRLGDSTLTLHFLDSLFGLDAYPVTPTGSQAVRTVSRAGETGAMGVPTLKLLVTDNT